MNFKIKQKMVNQVNNQIERKPSKGDNLLESLKQKRSEFKKQITLGQTDKERDSYKFEDSSELKSPNPGGDLVNATNNINTMNSVEIMSQPSKKETSIEAALLYDASLKPRKGDITPKSHITNPEKKDQIDQIDNNHEEVKKEEMKEEEISEERNVSNNQEKGDEDIKVTETNLVEPSPELKDDILNTESNENINVEDNEYCNYMSNAPKEEKASTFPGDNLQENLVEKIVKNKLKDGEGRNANIHNYDNALFDDIGHMKSSKSISSEGGDNISITSQSDEIVKKLQERLALKGKDMIINTSGKNTTHKEAANDNALEKTDNPHPEPNNPNPVNPSNPTPNTINLKLNLEKNSNSLDEDSPIHHHIDNPCPQSIVNNLKMKTSANFSNNNHFSPKTDTDYSKFNLQQIHYDLVKQYTRTKISKNENFMQRMLFDVFKRQTRDDRLNNLVEKNKLKLNEVDRVNAFNRLIDDANRRLDAAERLDSMKNNLDQKVVTKSVTSRDWDRVYNERFIKFKKEKEEILEMKIIEREKKLKEDEDKIIEEINGRIKKAPKKAIEKVVSRMYEEAEKRKIVNEQKAKEVEMFMEKQNKEMLLSSKRVKKEIDFKIQSDLFKPTSAYLSKVNNKKSMRKVDTMPHATKKSVQIPKKEVENFINEKYLAFSDQGEDEDMIRKVIPMPTESSIKSGEVTTSGNYHSQIEGRKHLININNELKLNYTSNPKAPSSNFPHSTKSYYNFSMSGSSNLNSQKTINKNKQIKYVPDLLAKNLVDNILKQKI